MKPLLAMFHLLFRGLCPHGLATPSVSRVELNQVQAWGRALGKVPSTSGELSELECATYKTTPNWNADSEGDRNGPA